MVNKPIKLVKLHQQNVKKPSQSSMNGITQKLISIQHSPSLLGVSLLFYFEMSEILEHHRISKERGL